MGDVAHDVEGGLFRVAPLLHVELGDRGIRIFSVDPGFVVTEKTEAIGAAEQYTRHFRPATPPVIGAVVAWLAADPDADSFAARSCSRSASASSGDCSRVAAPEGAGRRLGVESATESA